MENIAFRKVDITDGFWKQKQELNRKATIYSVWERFKETGRFDAFQFNWKEGMPNKPHIFWESDIAKWIEAVAYILEKEPDPSLENAVEEIIDCIEQHQDENGYFNIYFTVCEPESRFTRRTDHELYCAGHLIEAAVAYYESTGKDRFLKLMCKYADHIEQVFMMEQSANFVTPGHEEIELALVKLYHCTGKEKYLSLSKFFIDQRGANEKDKINHYNFASPSCDQSHLPAVEQETAEGHSVRACYLYSAMADLSKELKDEMLLSACKKLFANISERRMYITGGIGQSSLGEAFTIDYD
ncbi:MAG: glycoside hydrolase family 127 protein, partial [Clostridiales bacterium]|nr:glycoside hydrolase family 127 protein [Clostridiales bacterium]